MNQNQRKHLNPFPGTDDKTGWPVVPVQPCPKDELGLPVVPVQLCHLRLTDEPMVCVYEPGSCPFFGKYPDICKN